MTAAAVNRKNGYCRRDTQYNRVLTIERTMKMIRASEGALLRGRVLSVFRLPILVHNISYNGCNKSRNNKN